MAFRGPISICSQIFESGSSKKFFKCPQFTKDRPRGWIWLRHCIIHLFICVCVCVCVFILSYSQYHKSQNHINIKNKFDNDVILAENARHEAGGTKNVICKINELMKK